MKIRHEGARWSLLYGSYEGVEKFAIDEAQRYFQSYLPYVMRVECAGKNGVATPSGTTGSHRMPPNLSSFLPFWRNHSVSYSE